MGAPMLLDGDASCPGKIVESVARAPRTAGICFGCSRYGRRCEAPIAPAAHLVIPIYGASYWDCPNRRSSGANVTEVPADDPSPRIGGDVSDSSSTSGVSQ